MVSRMYSQFNSKLCDRLAAIAATKGDLDVEDDADFVFGDGTANDAASVVSAAWKAAKGKKKIWTFWKGDQTRIYYVGSFASVRKRLEALP